MAEKIAIKNQLQTIINTVHDGITAIDKNDIVTVFNPIAEEIFAFPKERVLGKSLKDKNFISSISIATRTNTSEQESFVKVRDKYIVFNWASIVGGRDTGCLISLLIVCLPIHSGLYNRNLTIV